MLQQPSIQALRYFSTSKRDSGVEMIFPLGLSMSEVVDVGEGAKVSVDKTIDVLGFYCPVPIVEARKALAEMEAGRVLEVWSDDPEVLHDMPLLLKRTNDVMLSIENDAGEYRMLIQKVE